MTASILSLPTVVASTHPIYVIDTRDLSDEARDYLRHGLVRRMLEEGVSKRDAAWFANVWAAGYRSFAKGHPRSQASGAALEGWEYAKGEDAYLLCMEIDAAQDSMDACSWPSSALW